MTKMTAEQVAADISRREQESIEKGKNSDDWIAVGMAAARGLVEDNLIETDEQRRERFEAWHRKTYGPSFDHMLGHAGDGYSNGGTNMMWVAFQAALTWRGETKGGGT